MARLAGLARRLVALGVREARREAGQTMAEYALILTGVALVVMATVLLLGGAIQGAFNNIIAQL